MDDVFNPSLLISLGPSSKKALELSRKLLSYMPEHFMNLIGFYDIEAVSMVREDLQTIIDERLLSAKYLNKLVDMGFKVRNDNRDSVKINIYLLWDVYNSTTSGYEVINILTKMNYGNVDRDLHTGTAIYVLPILGKEWESREALNTNAISQLEETIKYLSQEERMLSFDSRVYVLHCVSSDGSRVPKEELEYISSLLVYLNIIPSGDPPLSHFNRRLLMHEGKYKVGSVGITSLTVFVDQLLESFARYLSIDIFNYVLSSDKDIELSECRIYELIKYESQKNRIMKSINLSEDKNSYRLDEALFINLPQNISDYPRVFKNWEEYIENNYLVTAKNKIDLSLRENKNDINLIIDNEVKSMVEDYGLRTAVNYLDKLEEEISNQKSRDKTSTLDDLSVLYKKFSRFIKNYPDPIGMIYRFAVLAAFLLYSLIDIGFPHFNTGFKTGSVIFLFLITGAIAYLDYLYRKKKMNYYIQKYREEIFKKSGTMLNLYIEKMIVKNNKTLLKYIKDKKKELKGCIDNTAAAVQKLPPGLDEDEKIGNMVTSLLNFKDRHRFYRENRPDIILMYSKLIRRIRDYTEFQSEDIANQILDFSREEAVKFVNKDFYEFLRFKFKDNIDEEIGKWIGKGVIKSKYLLQYINDEALEEHSLFITSPEVFKMARDIIARKLGNFNVSIIEGDNVYTNSISIIRLCFGIDFDKISAVKNMKRGENNG